MEAAALPVRRALRSTAGTAVRKFLNRWGLIIALLALPVYFGVQDVINEHSLTHIFENLKDGVSNGAIWALVAIGYTLVYGIIELINFAHGDVFMIGSFVSFSIWTTIGLTLATGALGVVFGLVVTLIVAMIACGSLNVMIERVAYKPLRNAPKLAPLITAVGFSFILQNVGLEWYGGSQKGVDDLIHSQTIFFHIGGVEITHADVLAIGVTAPLVIVLAGFIARSRIGKAMRATAQDPAAARLMGINVDNTISFTFLVGGLMAGAAGLFAYLVLIMVFRPQGLLGEQTREAG